MTLFEGLAIRRSVLGSTYHLPICSYSGIVKAFEKTENKDGRETGWVVETPYSDRSFKATGEECM